MKKFLLLFSIVFATFSGFSQTTTFCATSYALLNDAGDCPAAPTGTCVGQPTATTLAGRVRVYFNPALPAGTPTPVLTSVMAGAVNLLDLYRFCATGDNVAVQRTFVDYCVYGTIATAPLLTTNLVGTLTINSCAVIQQQLPCPIAYTATDETACSATSCNPLFPNAVGAIRVFFPAGTTGDAPAITGATVAGVTILNRYAFCAASNQITTPGGDTAAYLDYCVYSNILNDALPITNTITFTLITLTQQVLNCVVPVLPCAPRYEVINQGGGNCPVQNGDICGPNFQATSTSTIRVFFSPCLPPGTPNPILTMATVDGVASATNFCLVAQGGVNAGIATERCFVDYCVYAATASTNFPRDAVLVFNYVFEIGGSLVQTNCDEQAIILPVTYKSINATRKNSSNVTVTWETATEVNNKGFNVQRNGGGGWETVAFVASKGNGGNSNSVLSYTFNDVNTSRGVTQYRVQQVDVDGKSSYSDIRAVRGEGLENRLLVYPNPSNSGSVNVVFEDQNAIRDVLVRDISGRLVKQYKEVTNNILVIDNLTSGVYSIQVTDRTTSKSVFEKIVVRRN